MARRRAAEAPSRERLSALAGVAGRFKKFRPAREVLTLVKAVPTRFPQFDHATRVGGLPIERFMLLHGPSNHGKTGIGGQHVRGGYEPGASSPAGRQPW